jgi:hypothetical protein
VSRPNLLVFMPDQLPVRARVLDWLLDTADVIPWHADPRFDAEGAV